MKGCWTFASSVCSVLSLVRCEWAFVANSSGAAAIGLARRRSGWRCHEGAWEAYPVDRIVAPDDSMLYELPCDRKAISLVLTFRPTNRVGSIRVRSGRTAEAVNFLDYFALSLLTAEGKKRACASWTMPFQTSGAPMRVNCKFDRQSFGSLMLSPSPRASRALREHEGPSVEFPISEIEIRSQEYSTVVGYYGCYETFEGVEFKDKSDDCMEHCYLLLNYFAILKEGTCFCSNVVPKIPLPDSDCLPRCSHTTGYLCGGESRHAVYVAHSPRIYSPGCYEYKPPTGTAENDMTVPKCIRKCAAEKMMALLMGSSHCVCLTSIPEKSVDQERCSSKCSGGDTTCGGNGVGLLYAGCHRGDAGSTCTEVFRCRNDNFDLYGTCQNGCLDDFFGPMCITREMPVGMAPAVSSNVDEKVKGEVAAARRARRKAKETSKKQPKRRENETTRAPPADPAPRSSPRARNDQTKGANMPQDETVGFSSVVAVAFVLIILLVVIMILVKITERYEMY